MNSSSFLVGLINELSSGIANHQLQGLVVETRCFASQVQTLLQ